MPSDLEPAIADLAPGGRLAAQLPGYELRESQLRMARTVATTFEHGGVLVVEAGTGTGKSLAYLVPAIHWARSHEERVIVSTRTINLQEQLVHSDLPFLQRSLGLDFRVALVKGRGNYVCLRKVAELRAQPSLLPEDTLRSELRTLLEWSQDTEDGSLADLGFLPRSEAWELVRVEHDDCLRSRCTEYESCFFYRARREAAKADLLVVNHSLLMADQALRASLPDDEQNAILPSASRLVLDEAHHLEDVSTDYFGARVTLRRLERALARLQHSKTPERGILPALLEKLVAVTSPEDRPGAEGAARWIDERLRPRIAEILRESGNAFDELHAAVAGQIRLGAPAVVTEELSLRVTPAVEKTPFWAHVVGLLTELANPIDAFVEAVSPVLERIRDFSSDTSERTLFLARQLEAQAGRLGAISADLRTFLADDPSVCRWLALRTDADRHSPPSLCLAPVEVGARLRDTVFERFEGMVLTSATLSVNGRFDYFSERTGLSGLPDGFVDTLRLPSPFAFSDQALLAIPDDLPEPDRPGYEERLHAAIERALRASHGGAFVLFTSYGALHRAVETLSPTLQRTGIDVLRQGESDRHTLLERFRRNRSSALFATDSFWEGVDVRGDGLRSVIIARLPFRVPTEPIQQARTESIEARGGNPFGEYGLPQAVIRLRQGFGRLVRSRDDCGVVWILDSRIVRRRYGHVLLSSLPPARLVTGPQDVVTAEVEAFFREVAK